MHRSTSDELTLTDDSVGIRYILRSVADTLTITDDAVGVNDTTYIGLLGEGVPGWDFLLGEFP